MEGNELSRLIERLKGSFLTRAEGVAACRVYTSVDLTIATATTTALLWNTELNNAAGMHSTSVNSSRMTIQTPGWYEFGASLEWESNAVGNRYIFFTLTGTVISTDAKVAFANMTHSAGSGYWCSATDYVECKVYQNSGGALKVRNAAGAVFSGMSANFWCAKKP